MKKTGRFAIPFILLAALCLSAAAGAPPEVPIGDSPSIGPADAPVVIVEFVNYR
jgi:hypothetical protein